MPIGKTPKNFADYIKSLAFQEQCFRSNNPIPAKAGIQSLAPASLEYDIAA